MIKITNNTITQYTSPVIFQNINKELKNSNTIQGIGTQAINNKENKQIPKDLNMTGKITDSDSNKNLANPSEIINNNIIYQKLPNHMYEIYTRTNNRTQVKDYTEYASDSITSYYNNISDSSYTTDSDNTPNNNHNVDKKITNLYQRYARQTKEYNTKIGNHFKKKITQQRLKLITKTEPQSQRSKPK